MQVFVQAAQLAVRPRNSQTPQGRTAVTRLVSVLLALCLTVAGAAAQQSATGLPFELDYGMTRQRAQEKMQTFNQYRVSTPADQLAYVISDATTATVNSFFLNFKSGRLMQIASVKSEMTEEFYRSYFAQMMQLTQKWVASGVEKVDEDTKNGMYLFRDLKSVIGVSATREPNGKYTLTLTFKDRRESALK